MTNRVGRPKLVENMTDEERIQHWQNERAKAREAKQERLDCLDADQLAAIKRMSKAIDSIMMSYHEMCHPTIGDIIELDDARYAFNRELNQED